jgi:protein-S-isoprenylcysteine O-methyltransferase Ste14
MIHPFAERWRTRRRSPYVVLIPAWVLMWALMALVTRPWRHVALYSDEWTWVPAALLFAAGITLYAKSGKGFSAKQLGGMPEVHGGHPEQRLVTHGIRAYVRHPVYLAHLCEMLAWSIGTGLAVCWALTAFAIATGAVMIRMEDAELEKRFQEEFRSYRHDVSAVVPKVNRTSFLLVLMTAICLVTLISAFLVSAAARKDQPMLFQHGTPEVPGARAFAIMNPFRNQDSEHMAERLIGDLRTTECERVLHSLSSDERICPIMRDNGEAHLMWRQDSDSAQMLVYDLPDVEARLWVSFSRRGNAWEMHGLSIVR